MRLPLLLPIVFTAAFIAPCPVSIGQTLEQQLQSEDPATLIRDAATQGDARRGAVIFHQPLMACSRCHQLQPASSEQPSSTQSPSESSLSEPSLPEPSLGPRLTKWDELPKDVDLLNAILYPSQTIRKGYEPVQVVTTAGQVVNGLLISESADTLSLRDASTGRKIRLPVEEIDERVTSKTSIMPAGQVNQLTSRQQFLDLLRYVMELRDGGTERARELQPPPSMFAVRIPEYEARVDHAGLIRDLNEDAFKRGETIYNRLCINCHGDHQKPGSLPTALRFAEGKFRNGSDPHTMYRTLTHGFGFMVAQTWMVPQQKYDVIHYIREAYLRSHNPSQYRETSDEYLAELPEGNTRGPEPARMDHWATMDYGPRLINTYEIGSDGSNFAYKGIAVRLDPGPGGVARGSAWMIFDHDTMRMAAAWTADSEKGGDRFIDWNGIHFNGRHGVHPRIVGQLQVAASTGPGWAEPRSATLEDDQRVTGRDGRRYGPLPRSWAQYHGVHSIGDRTIIDYSVGRTRIREMPGMISGDSSSVPLFTRTLQIGPREQDLTLVVGDCRSDSATLTADGLQAQLTTVREQPVERHGHLFDGTTWLETEPDISLDMTDRDFSIRATIRTKHDGTIFSRTAPDGDWRPNGKALFIRDGRLCYDIGWVGVVQSKDRIDDGQIHDVLLTWKQETAQATLFVDGKRQAQKTLRPTRPVKGHVVRIGYAAPDFPDPSCFQGEIHRVQFWQRLVTDQQSTGGRSRRALMADWKPHTVKQLTAVDSSGHRNDAGVRSEGSGQQRPSGLVAGLLTDVPGATWSQRGHRLCLTLPAGSEPLNIVLWFARHDPTTSITAPQPAAGLLHLPSAEESSPLWRDRVITQAITGQESAAFAVDLLTAPENNPWLAQTRLTGLDFFSDGDSMAVCSWDGDVWLVRGISSADPQTTLSWQRIAHGLFQPLGLKIIDGQIFVTCRDQIVVLEDHNGDGETDYYRCFNSDHQVTEHFHEFAMGLQVDDDGNLYYAKSARHAKTALVPHHGTLLRVSADGRKTDILATGFRAANGVCLNPDGTFVVTDQEGHWNPKNRINWVHKGGFYGNMFGYHDVVDSSDEAMQQPLCWITNAFDRSPGELLWVDSDSWGPLNGSLLNLSYGYGKVYVVPFETIDGQPQGGMCELPIPQFPTGTMRGRFHPSDGHLYVCGMFAWAGSRQHPGGLYRLRATGQPAWLPRRLTTHQNGLSIEFTDPLNRTDAAEPDRYHIKVWDLKRTASYGSEHFNERPLEVSSVTVSDDGRTVRLHIPQIAPTWCMEVRCQITTPEGRTEERAIHNTIHQLGQ